ncbi:MAG: hypothetical protein NDF54_00345 [archaeon GB-1867-035]|nr:hypothetical protein [Candidatus Culexmicrobium profundum]
MSYDKRAFFNSILSVRLRVKEEDLNKAITIFKLKFKDKSQSWIRRCIRRLIDISASPKPNTWIVRGRPILGDYEAFYIITLHRRDGKYSCTCYDPKKLFGYRRMKDICTHVGAVILWRMIKEKSIDDFIYHK